MYNTFSDWYIGHNCTLGSSTEDSVRNEQNRYVANGQKFDCPNENLLTLCLATVDINTILPSNLISFGLNFEISGCPKG